VRSLIGFAAALAVAALLAACGSTPKGPPVQRSHVVIVIFENKTFVDVLGSPEAPYINSLVPRAAVPKSMFGVAHPSLTNYLALTGGRTNGIKQDCISCHFHNPNIADQLERAGLTWKGYMEGMPRPCYQGAFAGRWDRNLNRRWIDPVARSLFPHGYGSAYAKKHDPFMYYDAIRNNPRRCANVVPFQRLAGDLRAGRLPDFAFISPDLCNSMHDCKVGAGDRFLSRLVPEILPRLGQHGFLVITWDEGRTNRRCCGGRAKAGRIPTLILGPDVRPGAGGSGDYDHYSTLRTIEDAFGLPHLNLAADPGSRPLDALFYHPPRFKAQDASG
jgi:phospholipase C